MRLTSAQLLISNSKVTSAPRVAILSFNDYNQRNTVLPRNTGNIILLICIKHNTSTELHK
jgi:hypothetical protein